jgi:chemotaxis protein histidine kinase CheA
MPKQQPIEIFMPPNILKAKVGGSGGIDPNALKRAEQAIEDMKEEFADWIVKDVDNLAAARSGFDKNRGEETLGTLYRSSLDLKGQATTFEFPMVARIAHSLCRLTDGAPDGGKALPATLIDAHVDAIRVIVRDKIKDPTNPVAVVLATELEKKVGDYLEKQPPR